MTFLASSSCATSPPMSPDWMTTIASTPLPVPRVVVRDLPAEDLADLVLVVGPGEGAAAADQGEDGDDGDQPRRSSRLLRLRLGPSGRRVPRVRATGSAAARHAATVGTSPAPCGGAGRALDRHRRGRRRLGRRDRERVGQPRRRELRRTRARPRPARRAPDVPAPRLRGGRCRPNWWSRQARLTGFRAGRPARPAVALPSARSRERSAG